MHIFAFRAFRRDSTRAKSTGQEVTPTFQKMRLAPMLFLALLSLLCFPPALPRASASTAAINALHYRIALDIPSAGPRIRAMTEILLSMEDERVRQADLDFAGLTIDGVTEDGKPARFTRSKGHLLISLEGNHKTGDRCQLTIKYHGSPGDGLSIKKNKFGDRTVFADNWPDRAHYWFPCFDTPKDKATAEFLVTAPDRYDVVANGKLVETRSLQDGRKLTHWSEEIPIPTYCMVVGVADFSIIHAGRYEGISLDYYLYPKDRHRGLKDYGRALPMLEFYSNLIGPYPYEKLALVESSTRFGGMENSSSIFFDERAYNGSGKLEGTVAHEIAHQWFGDSVTEGEWPHLWLSEGFATYFGHLFFERQDGRDKFLRLMLADKETYLKSHASGPRPVYDPSITDLFKLLNANNYQKGGWVLHMLRHIMGDTKFFAGIRDYYRVYRDGNAITPDFQKIMELHAGQPLGWFFQEWIYQPGYPILEASWQWNELNGEVRLHIVQKQTPTMYRMPVDVEFTVNGTSQQAIIRLEERDQTFTFKAPSKPRNFAIDPDEWVLKVLSLKEQ